ncbi:hypothetical protein [Hellea balneolensis]|uniref:hypothetical protein n=1 Tax=Hellea balneolensis TaxID=287478 RepID=UPI0004299017|nr:hypothetical protein [Hellea balneolensis]
MNKLFSYRWVVGAIIALFFALQSYSISHASTHGDAPHEHDGVACAVTVLSDDQTVIQPEKSLAAPLITETRSSDYPDFTSAPYVTPQGRAPPPRGPPASI